MAQSHFVPKVQLFNQLNEIIATRDTGLLTILTESNRSIFLRFSRGKLTRLYCRSGEAGEAIQMLAEGSMVKFTYANAPEDDQPEFMPTDSFMQLIDPGGDGGAPGPGSAVLSGSHLQVSDPIKAQMLEIATEFVGVVAEMIEAPPLDTFDEPDPTVPGPLLGGEPPHITIAIQVHADPGVAIP